MKILFITSSFFLLIILIFTTGYFNPEFKSAFEADQQCHFEMSSLISEMPELGCDHDIETRQWILFNPGTSNQPAEVVKRYRY